jgi:hypothetical protein
VNGANSGMELWRIHLTRISSDSGMAKYPSVPATLIAMAAVPIEAPGRLPRHCSQDAVPASPARRGR